MICLGNNLITSKTRKYPLCGYYLGPPVVVKEDNAEVWLKHYGTLRYRHTDMRKKLCVSWNNISHIYLFFSLSGLSNLTSKCYKTMATKSGQTLKPFKWQHEVKLEKCNNENSKSFPSYHPLIFIFVLRKENRKSK